MCLPFLTPANSSTKWVSNGITMRGESVQGLQSQREKRKGIHELDVNNLSFKTNIICSNTPALYSIFHLMTKSIKFHKLSPSTSFWGFYGVGETKRQKIYKLAEINPEWEGQLWQLTSDSVSSSSPASLWNSSRIPTQAYWTGLSILIKHRGAQHSLSFCPQHKLLFLTPPISPLPLWL